MTPRQLQLGLRWIDRENDYRAYVVRPCRICQRLCLGRTDTKKATCKRDHFVELFWSKVQKTSSCWLWIGGKTVGYGSFNFHGKSDLAHRISWRLTNGPIRGGMYICHHCDVRNCVRPSHLFLGTQKDNMVDCANKQRMPFGELHRHAKLTAKIVQEARRLYNGCHGHITILSKNYNVSSSTLASAIFGKTWRSIPLAHNPMTRTMKLLRIEAIRKDFVNFRTDKKLLAKRYGVSYRHVRKITSVNH